MLEESIFPPRCDSVRATTSPIGLIFPVKVNHYIQCTNIAFIWNNSIFFFSFFYETLFKVTSKLPNLPLSTLKFYYKRRTLPKHSSTVCVPRNFLRRQKSNLARRLIRNEHSSEALKANIALPHRVKWKDLVDTKTHPATYSTCNLHIDARRYSSFLLFKVPNEGQFFSLIQNPQFCL